MAPRWNAMEFHGMPWTLCYFHGISVELYGIQVECHGIPWNAMECHGRYVISMGFHGRIPWDTEDWYLDKISEWIYAVKYMEFGQQNGYQQ